MASRGAAVLLSGGIDSAVVLALLASSGREVSAIWIDYGQPAAAAEREASKVIASSYGVAWSELAVAGLVPPVAGEFPGRESTRQWRSARPLRLADPSRSECTQELIMQTARHLGSVGGRQC